jgi:hypothetical protein
LAKGTAEPSTYCWLATWFNWSMWVAIINLQPFAVTVLVLWVKLGKK